MTRRTGVASKVARLAFLALLGLYVGTSGVRAQQNPPTGQPQFFPPDTAFVPQARDGVSEPVTPRGAFLRSLTIPGWGHVATGTYTRGGLYVAMQGGALWMLGTALRRQSDAEELLRLERMVVRSRLEGMGMADPDSIAVGIAADPSVQSWEALEESRGQQVEDWTAVSIFLVILGAADAYVSAHLMDFPEPLTVRPLPSTLDGGVELSLSFPLGRPKPGRTAR